MERMKKFFIYFIAIVLFYFLSNMLINISLKTSYNDISNNSQINTGAYEVTITQASATNANGAIVGTVKNKEKTAQEHTYLKIDFLNSRNNLMGTKYVDVSDVYRR